MKKGALTIRILGGVLLVGALSWFAYANSGQSVELKFGLFTLRGLSLPFVVYASVIVGMLVVLGVSFRSDLRARQALRRYDQIAADVLGGIEDESETAREEVRNKS